MTQNSPSPVRSQCVPSAFYHSQGSKWVFYSERRPEEVTLDGLVHSYEWKKKVLTINLSKEEGFRDGHRIRLVYGQD